MRPVASLATLLLATALAAVLGGCFLPIATAAPESAETVGKGQWGGSLRLELPTLDLIADESEGSTDTVAVAPAGAVNIGLSYGVGAHVDLEVALEAALYFFVLPLPTGLSGGVRVQLLDTSAVDVALAGRVGWVASNTTQGDGESAREDKASARFFAGSLAVQGGGRLRPGLTLQLMPADVDVDLADEAPRGFRAIAMSATASVELRGEATSFTPFLAVTYFDSPDVEAERFVSVGLAVQRRSRPAPTAPPPLPAPGPSLAPAPPPVAPPPSPTRGE